MRSWLVCSVLIALAAVIMPGSMPFADAANADQLSKDAQEALHRLYRASDTAAAVGRNARAVLVFPRIIKAGLVARPFTAFGGSYGEGALIKGGQTVGYFNSASSVWGRKDNEQAYSYAVFLMTPAAEDHLTQGGSWQIGAGPTLMVVDEGAARQLSATTPGDDAYAFVFDQNGLIVGTSLEGAKISRIKN